MFLRRIIACFLVTLLAGATYSQNASVKIKVIDAQTQAPVEFANVHMQKALSGGMADEKGELTFLTNVFPDTLIISFIGYKPLRLKVAEPPKSRLLVKLEQNAAQLSEVEVLVYQDPGKHLMQQVLANRSRNDLRRFDNSVYNEYRKTEVDILNLDPDRKTGPLKNIANVYNAFSKDSVADKAPVFFTEKYFRTYHSNQLQTHVEHELARKELGLSTDKLGAQLVKFELKVNIYDGIIPILKTSFLSPVSVLGLLYYKFTPLDTLMDGELRIVRLKMTPKVKNENTFEGTIWVEDHSYAIVKFDLATTSGSNINFISRLGIKQEYRYLTNPENMPGGYWVPRTYKTTINFNNGLDLLGIPVPGDTASKKVQLVVTSAFDNYVINSVGLNANNFYTQFSAQDSAGTGKPANGFEETRQRQLTEKEKAIYKTMDSLKTDKRFVRETKLTSMLATGYWDAGCRLRFGPLSSLASTNLIEGLRIRSGFWTLPCVSKIFNFNAYAAYGFRDKVLKGGVGIKYVPKLKRYFKTEIFARSDYDALLEFDDEMDRDNVFTLALRKKVPAYQVFIQQIRLLQEIDLNQNWSAKGWLAIKSLDPSFNYQYYKLINDQVVDFTPLKKINVNEVGFILRYGHNERSTIFNYDKIRLYSPYPVLNFSYVYGFEGTKNTYFDYHKFVVTASQELTLPLKGSLFYYASAGKMFGLVPAILLFAPTGNAYYVANKYTFNNMLPYEFAADRYLSLMLRYNMGGLLLSKVPLLNKMKLRERVIFNNYLGTISKTNKDFNKINPVKETGRTPYSEVGVGIGNIFHVLSLDAIWRVSQFNHNLPLTRFGIYTTMMLVF